MNNFALIGAAGYIAPVICGPSRRPVMNWCVPLILTMESASWIAIFQKLIFTEPERFDRHLDKLRRQEEKNRLCEHLFPELPS